MQREDEKNKKRKVEEESYEAQEKRPNIQREREREEGREEGSGNWDCLGEISGAPVPPWNEFQYFIFIIHTSLSLSLSLPPSLSFYMYFIIIHASPSPSLSALISKKGCLILLHTTTKWRWVQSQSMPSLPLCIYPVFVLIVITFVTFSSSTLENN